MHSVREDAVHESREAKKDGLYTEDKGKIRSRIEKEGLLNAFSEKIASQRS